MLSVNKVAVVTATPLYVVGAIAYGPDFDAGFEGSCEEFLPAFIGSTLIVMSNPLSFGAFLGDWSRYIPATASKLQLMLAAFFSQLATFIPFVFGLATASIIASKASEGGQALYSVGLVEVPQPLPVHAARRHDRHRDRPGGALHGRDHHSDHHLRNADHRLHDAMGGDHDDRLHRPPRLLPLRRPAGLQPRAEGRQLLFSGGYDWRGLGAWIRAAVLGIPFVNIPGQFEGPLRNTFGGKVEGVDVSLAVVIALAALFYLLLELVFP